MAERRHKGSPLKDVAGMIRSFHYAAHTVFFSEKELSLDEGPLKPWRLAWQEWIGAVFLKAYFDTAAGAPFLPAGDPGLLLEIFLLEKVFYELRYELNNRPDWVRIPLAGIIDIIDRNRSQGKVPPD
jgi:predicted trehalose synthase